MKCLLSFLIMLCITLPITATKLACRVKGCTRYGEPYAGKDGLFRHNQSIHLKKKFYCPHPKCKSSFTRNATLQHHLTLHVSKENNFAPAHTLQQQIRSKEAAAATALLQLARTTANVKGAKRKLNEEAEAQPIAKRMKQDMDACTLLLQLKTPCPRQSLSKAIRLLEENFHPERFYLCKFSPNSLH